MIAVDTSALMAILLGEPTAAACERALIDADELLISAGTVAEALIVAGRREVGAEMRRLIDETGFRIVEVNAASADRVARAYAAWGRGVHPAALNLGDCFAYVVAKDHGCRLLFVGNDFARTDIDRAS